MFSTTTTSFYLQWLLLFHCFYLYQCGILLTKRIPSSSADSLLSGLPQHAEVRDDPAGTHVLNQTEHAHLTKDIIAQRNALLFPFVGLDFFVGKANIFVESIQANRSIVDTYVQRVTHEFHKHPIVFIQTDHLHYYIDTLIHITVNFTLITISNFPFCVPYFAFPKYCTESAYLHDLVCGNMNKLLYSPYLLRWYTKNPCIQHEKLIPIPIGPKWQTKSLYFFAEGTLEPLRSLYQQYGTTPEAYFKNDTMTIHAKGVDVTFAGKTELLYFNFNVNTTPTGTLYGFHELIRPKIHTQLKARGFEEQPNVPTAAYLQTMSRYKFAIAPPGAGIDTHRTWEALMVGTIPIVLSSPLDALYDDLPVLIVEDYALITEHLLYSTYVHFHNSTYSFKFDKLFMKYWNKMVY